MTKISMLEFRHDAEAVIRRVQQGKRFILTYRGKPVMRLEPIQQRADAASDSFYSLPELADEGQSITNEEIDRIVYEGREKAR